MHLQECLSIGNNRIANIDQLIKLRQIKSLKMLAIAGNPVTQDAECNAIILSYLDRYVCVCAYVGVGVGVGVGDASCSSV